MPCKGVALSMEQSIQPAFGAVVAECDMVCIVVAMSRQKLTLHRRGACHAACLPVAQAQAAGGTGGVEPATQSTLRVSRKTASCAPACQPEIIRLQSER